MLRRRLKRMLICVAGSVFILKLVFNGILKKEVSPSDGVPPGSLHQSDPILHDVIRRRFFVYPDMKPYNLTNPHTSWFSQHHLEPVIRTLVKNKKHGVFFEAGAYDGETFSNSLYFERELSWTGVLVEPSSESFKALLSKHRKAVMVPGCVSSYPYTNKVNFTSVGQLSFITDENIARKNAPLFSCLNHSLAISMNLDSGIYKSLAEELECVTKTSDQLVECLPLYSILAAAGYETIDFMSLDVEGTEMAVISTIPFNRLNIKVLLIETDKMNEPGVLVDFLRIQGYRKLERVAGYNIAKMLTNDMLFIKT